MIEVLAATSPPHLHDTSSVDQHLRWMRVSEQEELVDYWQPRWGEARLLPPWLSEHPAGSAARKLLARPHLGTSDLLRRACEDEASRRIARYCLLEPGATAPRPRA